MARLAVTRVDVRKAGGLTVTGLKELYDNLDKILNRTRSEALKGEFLKAGNVVRDQAKANAPYDAKRKSGFHLRDAIFCAPGKETASDVLVGVSRSKRKTGSPAAPHGLLVHHGTKERFTKAGASRGQVQGNPFFAKAVAQTRGRVATMIADTLKDAIFKP